MKLRLCVVAVAMSAIFAAPGAKADVVATPQLRTVASTVSPTYNIRLGALVSPDKSLLAGIDLDLPQFTMGSTMRGRLDIDVLLRDGTKIPITIDQIQYSVGSPNGHSIYYGFGVGAQVKGSTTGLAKLILGTQLSQKLGVEANALFSTGQTQITVMARLHL